VRAAVGKREEGQESSFVVMKSHVNNIHQRKKTGCVDKVLGGGLYERGEIGTRGKKEARQRRRVVSSGGASPEEKILFRAGLMERKKNVKCRAQKKEKIETEEGSRLRNGKGTN